MKHFNITLYGILDPEHSLGRDLSELARLSGDHGVTLVQYRDKINDAGLMIRNAREIQAALAGHDIPLIINDRVDVALATGAAGVHLGQSDMDVRDARNILGPDAVIGLSVKTVAEARSCPVDLIDYAFVGGVFETGSKDNPAAIGIDGWLERANILKNLSPGLPVGAIAGIDHTNAGQLMGAGCDGIAVISAIYRAQDVPAAIRRLRDSMEIRQ